MAKDLPSAFEARQLSRDFMDRVFDNNLYGAAEPAPAGTLRGIDVLPSSLVRQKLSRAAQIFSGARGRLPNFVTPTSFYEKLAIAKFFAPIPMPSAADKLGCGTYIAEEHKKDVSTIPPVWSGNTAITHDLLTKLDLPAGRYFAKSNCGSGTNDSFMWPASPEEIQLLAEKSGAWLQYEHGVKAGEWWYGLIRPQNLIEPDFAPTPDASLSDWKFHVGGGRTFAVQLDLDRSTAHRQLMFDRDFNFINEELFFQTGTPVSKPSQYDKALQVAEAIGAHFEYARVDLYIVEDAVYLGEITLAPIGGQRVPRSEALDEIMGGSWQSSFFALT